MAIDSYEDSSQQDFSNSKADFDKKKIWRVIRAIADAKAIYKSELSRRTAVDQSSLGQMLYALRDAGIVERLEVTQKAYATDERVLARVPELWSRGMTGYQSIRKMDFFGLNSDHDWILSVEQDGEIYINEYHQVYEDSPDLPSGSYKTADKKLSEIEAIDVSSVLADEMDLY